MRRITTTTDHRPSATTQPHTSAASTRKPDPDPQIVVDEARLLRKLFPSGAERKLVISSTYIYLSQPTHFRYTRVTYTATSNPT